MFYNTLYLLQIFLILKLISIGLRALEYLCNLSTMYILLIIIITTSIAGSLYGKILTEVVSTDRTQRLESKRRENTYICFV